MAAGGGAGRTMPAAARGAGCRCRTAPTRAICAFGQLLTKPSGYSITSDDHPSTSCPRLSRASTSFFVRPRRGRPGHLARRRASRFWPAMTAALAACYKPRMSRPGPISAKPLSVLLSDVFSDAYAKQGFAARELVTRWSEIAGADIARHSEPLRMQWPRPVEGQPQEPATLVLRVEGPAALEIQHKSDVILERVNRFFGWSAVGRLALRQAPLSRRQGPAGSSAPDPQAVAEVAETLSSVDDEQLRA